MKKFRTIISLILALITVFSLCGCRISLPEPQEISTADEMAAMGFSADSYKEEMTVGEYAFFSVNIKYDYEYEVQWSSSNTDVATVDSNGRENAKKAGQVTITARAKKSSVDYNVTVEKARSKTLCNSTAIIKNDAQVQQNKTNVNNVNLYALLVNPKYNVVTAYTYNSAGTMNVPVRAMVCATGKNMTETSYTVESREEWHSGGTNSYHYVTWFGGLCLSTAPYKSEDSSTLVTEAYNKIGTNQSNGNIWLSAADAKWIYDNCPDTTLVRVSTEIKPPLGVPVALSIPEDGKNSTWDPTDPDTNNPYKNSIPSFTGVEEKLVEAGGTFNARENVVAYDSIGNELTSRIVVDGTVPCNRVGTYNVTYTCTDDMKRTGRADRVVRVVTTEEYEAYMATMPTTETAE